MKKSVACCFQKRLECQSKKKKKNCCQNNNYQIVLCMEIGGGPCLYVNREMEVQ